MSTTKEVIQQTEVKMKKALESVSREFSEVRTGRAHPGLLEGLHVECYGSVTVLKQIAAITVPEPKVITVQPWDNSIIPDIERAIANSKLGLSPANDGKLIRINIPPLSKERREELMKTVKDMSENGRVSLRTIRRDANDKIKKMQADNVVPKDDAFRAQDEIQKLTDKYIKQIDSILEAKNKDLSEIH